MRDLMRILLEALSLLEEAASIIKRRCCANEECTCDAAEFKRRYAEWKKSLEDHP